MFIMRCFVDPTSSLYLTERSYECLFVGMESLFEMFSELGKQKGLLYIWFDVEKELKQKVIIPFEFVREMDAIIPKKHCLVRHSGEIKEK